MCDELDVDFEDAATSWNNGYNEGYNKLGMGHVTRPVLYPPDKIGGHCIIPNTKLLKDSFDNSILDLILKWEK